MNDNLEAQPTAGDTPDPLRETYERAADLTVPSVPTPEARREATPELPDQTFSELWDKTVERDWIGSGVSRAMEETPDADTSFSLTDLTKDQTDTLFKDLDRELWDEYEGAVSYDHAVKIREHLDNATKLEADLARAGFKGIGVRLLANALDPVALSATLATEGLAAPVIYGAKLSRLGRMLRTAGVGAATEAGIEGALVATGDPYRDGTDVVLAAAIGGTLGAIPGAVMPGTQGQRLADAMNSAGRDAMNGTRHSFRVDENDNVTTQPIGPSDRSGLSDRSGPEVQSAAPPQGSAGAAYRPTVRDYHTARDDEWVATWDAERPVREDVTGQFDLYSEAARSRHAGVAWAMDQLTPNPSGVRTTGKPQTATAWEETTNVFSTVMAKENRVRNEAYKAWAAERGLSLVQRQSARNVEAFEEAVAMAVRGQETTDANVLRLAQRVQANNRELLRRAQEAGVEGFENVTENANYLTRRYNLKRFEAKRAEMGDTYFTRFLADAIRSGARKAGDDVDDDRAWVIAEATRRAVVEGKYGVDGQVPIGSLKDTLETVTDGLAERLGRTVEVDEALEEELYDALAGVTRGPEPKSSRAKRRVTLDELYADGRGNRVADLLENNTHRLQQDYTRHMAGLIGMARMGFKGDGDWDALTRRLRKTGAHYGLAPHQVEGQERLLGMVRKMVLGQAIHDPHEYQGLKRAARLARNYNFARLMGVVGFAQIAETGNILGQMGWKATLRGVPGLRKTMRRLEETGQFDDALGEDIEAMLGLGVERLNMDRTGRYDEFMAPEMAGFTRADEALQRVNRTVGDVSGLNPITAGLDRMAARAALQRLGSYALSEGAGLSKRRLLSLGLDDGMAGRIAGQLRDKAEWIEGSVTGRRIAALKLETWDDPEAANALVTATQRWVRRAIQKPDPGDLNKLLTTETGKIIFQFRNFVMVAWGKQLLHGVRMRDAATMQSFMATTLFGGLAYVSMVAAQSVGKPDAREFLEERLTLENIAASAFYRAGWMSLFPGMIDTAMDVTGHDPLFAFARTTGLATSFVGNPTLDLLDTAYSAAKPVLSGDEMDARDWRRIARLAAFQNTLVIGNGLDAVSGGLAGE